MAQPQWKSKGLILLTGGTGHVGFATLIEALDQGYAVRAAVRSQSKIQAIKDTASWKSRSVHVDFIVVPDFQVEGAFDEAVKGVDGVIHVASPVPTSTLDTTTEFAEPAIQCTLNLLRSALKVPSIKRVVITSSVAAIMPQEPTLFNADIISPEPPQPYPKGFDGYMISKVLAARRTEEFIEKKKPHFAIINIMPSFVIGRNELATTIQAIQSGSNSVLLAPMLGFKLPAPLPPMFCHIDDVAFVHVAALGDKIESKNQNFGINYDYTQGFTYNDACDIVKKNHPEAVEKGILPLGGNVDPTYGTFDASGTEKAFGFKHRGPEEMVKSIVDWYVTVWESEQKK